MGSEPRFIINRNLIDGTRARLEGPQFHHLRDVLRMGPGAPLTLLDERGGLYRGHVVALDGIGATLSIAPVAPPPAALKPLILAVAIIKGPRMDFLVEKAVELGADAIWPLLTVRGVVREPGPERLARWRRLAQAAAKQSLCSRPPQVVMPMTLAQCLEMRPPDLMPVICQAGGSPLPAVIKEARGALLMCGPEGDFTPQELALARRAGFIGASLGPQRLRSETAALAALAIAMALLNSDGEVSTQP